MSVEELEMGSLDISAQDEAATTDETVVDQSPDSSSEAKDDDKFDLLSVVRDAVKTGDEKAGDAASSADTEEERSGSEGSTADSETQSGEPDDENFSDVPFHNHPRFKQLITQRNQYREGAQQYEQVQSFLQQNNISPEEAADVLHLRALMKTDPVKAWEQLKPIAQELLKEAGHVLPADLQQRVQTGELTKEAAAEISRLRATQGTTQRQIEAQRLAAEREQQQRALSDVRDAVGSWEANIRKTDPDIAAKMDDLQREVIWLQRQEGQPTTADGARKQLQKAYEAVNQRFAAGRKPKPGVRPVTGGRAAGTNGTAEPKSVLDIVKANRATG